MSEIKPVITLLCKHLKLLYGCNIKPEHFRLAKFNEFSDSTVSQFWEVLYEICRKEIKLKVCDEDHIVDFVKLNFSLLKYESVDFYCLPPDMSGGSRELLMAFAWLIATKHVLEIATRDKIAQSSVNMEFGCFKMKEDYKKPEATITNNLKSLSNYILIIGNQIHKNLKIIRELDQQKTSLLHKVHEATLNVCGLPHLSVGDAKIIYDDSNSKLAMDQLKNEILLVDTHMQWNKKSHLFWEWMATVVDEKEKSSKRMYNTEDRCILLSYLQLLRRNVHSTMKILEKNNSPNKNCLKKIVDTSMEPFSGVPRYLLQTKGTEIEVEQWEQDAENLAEELSKKCNILLSDVQDCLEERASNLKNILIVKR